METVKGYFDYNISEDVVKKHQFPQIAKILLQYGYRTIAINTTINKEDLQNNKPKKKKGTDSNTSELVPPPVKCENIEGLKVFSRLTIVFEKQEDIFAVIKSKNYQLYDIVAVLPASKSALQHACNSLDFDIFCFDPLLSKQEFNLNRKLYEQLVNKGVHFEICYGPVILDCTQRKNTIGFAHLCHLFGKSKNVIVSSGATSPYTIRSPYDIINLGHLFGLKEEQSKNSVLHNGRSVFINSVRRKCKPLVFIPKDVKIKEVVKMEIDEPAQKKTKV